MSVYSINKILNFCFSVTYFFVDAMGEVALILLDDILGRSNTSLKYAACPDLTESLYNFTAAFFI